MSEKAAALLASVLKMDSVDLSTDDGIKAVEERVKALKVYTPEEFSGVLNNYKASLDDNFKKEKDNLYKENKIQIHAAIEKELVEKYGLPSDDLKGKKTTEYIDKIIELRGAGKTDDAKVIEEKLTKLLADNKAEYEKRIGETKSQYEKRIMDMYLDSEMKSVETVLDVDDEKRSAQLEFIKYQFNKDYRVEERDGKYVVLKGEEVVRDANFQPKSVNSVMMEVAEKFAPIKKKAPAGRPKGNGLPGGNGNNGDNIDWSQFNEFTDFMQTDRGKHLTQGSKEWLEYYTSFKKAKGLN